MIRLIMSLSVILATIAFADSNLILSSNIVGYVDKEVPSSGYIIVANPFLNHDKQEMTIDEIFGTSMPDGTELHVYSNSYSTYTYISYLGGWLNEIGQNASDVVISRGQGFWVKNPTSSPLVVTLFGNVPGNDFQTAANNLPSGSSLIASYYPAKRTIANLGFTPVDGDALYVYDNGYTTYTYFTELGWVDRSYNPAGDDEINIAEGFWYSAQTPQVWIQTKPYADF